MGEDERVCKNCYWCQEGPVDVMDVTKRPLACMLEPPTVLIVPTQQGPFPMGVPPPVQPNGRCRHWVAKIKGAVQTN